MSAELQPALQVTTPHGALDGHILLIFGIMVVMGILGGVANFYLADRHGEGGRRDWVKYPVFGVVAALTVPLFLNMISSTLLEGARTKPIDYYVFAGFCLIYVVASRRLVENVANKLRFQMDQMKREMVQLKQQRSEAVTTLVRDEPTVAGEAAPPVVKAEAIKESLSYNDIEIIRALSEDSYVYGNLAGLTDKTGLARELVSSRLTVLKSLGVIETRINDKNVLHWFVSPKGKQMLGDILSGQEDR